MDPEIWKGSDEVLAVLFVALAAVVCGVVFCFSSPFEASRMGWWSLGLTALDS